jgi:hypothetical protein
MEETIRQEYETLLRGPKRISIEKWLNRWIALAPRLRATEIPNLSESQACKGFIQASEIINPAFYNSVMQSIDSADKEIRRFEQLQTAITVLQANTQADSEASSSTLQEEPQAWQRTLNNQFQVIKDDIDPHKLTLAELVNRFKSILPSRKAEKTARATHATFQGQNHESIKKSEESSGSDTTKDLKRSKNRRKKPNIRKKDQKSGKTDSNCVCGSNHPIHRCYYLVPIIAPKDWSPSDETKANIVRSVSGNQRLDQAVRGALKKDGRDLPNWYPNREKTSKDPQEADKPASFSSGRAAFTVQRQAMSSQAQSRNTNLFRLDSCSDTHVCNDLEQFHSFKPSQDEAVKVGDTETAIEGIGIVHIPVQGLNGPQWIELQDVAYCPGFHLNLVSYIRLKAKGVRWNDESGWLMKDGAKFAQVMNHQGWPVIEPQASIKPPQDIPRSQRYTMATSSRSIKTSSGSMNRWHARLGHIRPETLHHLSESVEGVQIDDNLFHQETELCPECVQGQLSRQISRLPAYKGLYPFEKVHFDLILVKEAFNNDLWILHFYCALAAYHITFTLPSKNGQELVTAKETLIKLTQAWGYTIRQFHSDGERSLNTQWHELIRIAGITYRFSPPNTAEQNGGAERSGGVILTMARKIYLESGLPIKLWPYFIDHATRILNRIPVQRKKWTTPYKIVHGRRPNLAGFKIIGSKTYVLIKNEKQRPRLDKITSKTITGYLIGVEAANIFLVWIPSLDRVVYARDVAIDEQDLFKGNQESDPSPSELTELQADLNIIDLDDEQIDELVHQEYMPREVKAQQSQSSQSQPLPSPEPEDSDEMEEIEVSERLEPQTTRGLLTPEQSEDLESLQENSNPLQDTSSPQQNTVQRQTRPTVVDALRGLRTRTGRVIKPSERATDAMRSAKATKRQQRYAYALSYLQEDSGIRQAFASASSSKLRPHISQLPPEPKSWKAMLKHPESKGFKEAAQEEIKQLQANETWEEVSSPQGHQVLPLTWVFKYKTDPEGYLVRHKARLCVRGDLQWPSYEDIYAATGAYRTFRVLMALVAAFDLICEQGDVKNAFTKARLNQEIFTHLPPGFQRSGQAYRLKKALYGLKISPKLWYNELSTYLKSLGFDPCSDEPCLFIHPQDQILIFIYVDDLLFIAHSSREDKLRQIKQNLHKKYSIQDLGQAHSFLNIRILREGKKLWLLQDTYLEKLGLKFNQASSRIVKTPLSASFKAVPFDSQATPNQIMAYQQRIGSLIYPAIITRPDVAFAVSILSQFNQNPSPQHTMEADRVIAYLYHSRYLALEYSNEQPRQEVFQAASDASFADDQETRKSSQGFILSLFNGPVAWQASKQKTVTTSTTEAELLSLSHASREVINILRLFHQISFDPEHIPVILCDNQQSVRLIQAERPQLTTKLKHVDIHHFWLRQTWKDNIVQVQWVPTQEMPADGFTKRLSRDKQYLFIQALGMSDIQEKLKNTQAHDQETNGDESSTE